jgi:3-oxosteroid 1-dehydrogenase
MSADGKTTGWAEEYDVVVIGSGAGGMTAALCAQAQGLSAVVLEKSDKYGGTSAVSGGGIWVPCNDEMKAHGGSDSYADARQYLDTLIGNSVAPERIDAYLRNAPKMVRFLASKHGVAFRCVPKYPDYYPDRPGGKEGYRSLEPVPFDASRLGEEFFNQREAFKGTQLMGRVGMDQIQAHILFTRAKGWLLLTLKLMLRYWLDLGWRGTTQRDRWQVLGQGLVAQLRHAMLRSKVPLKLSTGLESLIESQGVVSGIVAVQNGHAIRIGARRGVVLAAGGFESNQQMREQYLPHPTQIKWTAAPPINHGDGIRAGKALGAKLDFMHKTWGSPTVNVPGAPQQTTLFIERALPGCLIVNKLGRRFVNEATSYPDVVDAMYADHAKTGGSVPCWIVFDATFRYKYPMGPLMPGQIAPDKKLPAAWLDQVYFRADTLEALAAKIGVDAEGLRESARRIGEYAKTGIDPEFGKGKTSIDRYYSDPKVKPNSCLGPVKKAPFYAVRLDAGEIGTKGGLLTDEYARVLHENGSVIGGLYAIGNCSSAVMGPTYAGAGSTLGPAMTFAYVAALDMAQADSAVRSESKVSAAA